MHTYRHIDPAVLLQAVGGDAAAWRSLTLTYLEAAPPMHAQLQGALRSGDCGAAAYAAHALKGSTTLVGAGPLSAALQALEAHARAGRQEALAPAAPGLAQLFEAALAEVERSLAAGAAG